MTIQEAYERIREYFSQPDAILAKANNACFYRMPDNNAKCAVGCLIPDEIYTAELDSIGGLSEVFDYGRKRGEDNHTYTQLERAARPVVEFFNLDNDQDLYYFLADIQNLHDRVAEDAEDFVRLLDQEADERNLQLVASPFLQNVDPGDENDHPEAA